MVTRHASPEEGVTLDKYCADYRAAFGRSPHGLHYLRLPGEELTVAIWFAPDDL